jgi:hypothetical protein
MEAISNQATGCFLRCLWEPADSPDRPAILRQCDRLIARGRKPQGEVWFAVGQHNADWLSDRGVKTQSTASLFHAIQAAVKDCGAMLWLGLDLLCVYSIRPKLFWPKMADGREVRFSLQHGGPWGGNAIGPFGKAIYCRDSSAAARLLQIADANPERTIGEVLTVYYESTAKTRRKPDSSWDLPIIRHAKNIAKPAPAIFQETRQLWRMRGGLVPSDIASAGNVTIVITGYNQGRFLKDSIGSSLAQTAKPRVIYVDDGSTDDSLSIARSFPVEVMALPHAGVVAARNAGLAEVKTERVVFLDGDDKLPEQFIEAKLAAVERTAADFVYSPSQNFGNSNHLMDVPPWDIARLWHGNYISTSTLFRKRDILSVGGWRNTLEQNCWDWDLALRCGFAGLRGVPERSVPLLYRRHDAGVSINRSKEEQGAEGYLVRSGIGPVGILCVWSGRIRYFERWLKAVITAVHGWRKAVLALRTARPLASDPPRPSLLIVATGNDAPDFDFVPGAAREFSSVGVIRERWSIPPNTDPTYTVTVASKLADVYSRMVCASGCQVIWSVEDDILVPPNAMADLSKALLWNPVEAASGIYRNRHDPRYIVGCDWSRSSMGELRFAQVSSVKQDTQKQLSGTGCLMWARPLVPHTFRPFFDAIPAHDYAWSSATRGVQFVSSVQCRHYQTEESWV